ncbi:unnamed protein product [Closterium sp. Naga37s-1]|nr:unnamed protein product [Closterium sp. Naga37s-1]
MPALPPTLAAAAPVAWGGGSLVDGRAAFSADGQRLLCPCGAVVRVFALASATQVRIPPPRCASRSEVAVLQGHTALVTCVSTSAVARSPAASAAAARGADDDDDHMGINPPADVSAPDSATSSMVYAWSGSLDGTMRLWNFVTGASLRVLHLGRPIRDLVMYPYASTEMVEGAGGREEERAVAPVALVVVGNEQRGCDLLHYDVFQDRCLKTLFHQVAPPPGRSSTRSLLHQVAPPPGRSSTSCSCPPRWPSAQRRGACWRWRRGGRCSWRTARAPRTTRACTCTTAARSHASPSTPMTSRCAAPFPPCALSPQCPHAPMPPCPRCCSCHATRAPHDAPAAPHDAPAAPHDAPAAPHDAPAAPHDAPAAPHDAPAAPHDAPAAPHDAPAAPHDAPAAPHDAPAAPHDAPAAPHDAPAAPHDAPAAPHDAPAAPHDAPAAPHDAPAAPHDAPAAPHDAPAAPHDAPAAPHDAPAAPHDAPAAPHDAPAAPHDAPAAPHDAPAAPHDAPAAPHDAPAAPHDAPAAPHDAPAAPHDAPAAPHDAPAAPHDAPAAPHDAPAAPHDAPAAPHDAPAAPHDAPAAPHDAPAAPHDAPAAPHDAPAAPHDAPAAPHDAPAAPHDAPAAPHDAPAAPHDAPAAPHDAPAAPHDAPAAPHDAPAAPHDAPAAPHDAPAAPHDAPAAPHDAPAAPAAVPSFLSRSSFPRAPHMSHLPRAPSLSRPACVQVAAGDVLGRVVVWHGIGRRSGWAWGEGQARGAPAGGRAGREGGWRGGRGRGGGRGGQGGGGGRWGAGRGGGAAGAGEGEEGEGEEEGEGRRGAEGEEDCEAVSSLHWHASAVADLAFSPDGVHLVSIGAEAVALVWQLQSGARRFLPRMPAALLRLVLPPSLLPPLPPPSPSTPSAAAAAGGAGGARSLVAPLAAPEALRFGMQCADNSVRVVDLSESSLIASIRGIAPPPPTRPLPARHFILPPLDPFKSPLGPLPSSASATSSSLSNCLPADVARQLAVELAVTGGGAPSAVVQSVRGGSARLVVVGPLGLVQVYEVGRQQVVAAVQLMRINVVSSAEARFKRALKLQEMQQRDQAVRLLQGGQGKAQQPQPQQQGPKPPPIWVSHVCFSPDGHTLVTVEIRQPEDLAGQQSTLKFWAAPFGGTQGVRQGSGKGGKGGKEGLTALTTAVDAPHGAAGLVTGVHVRAGGDMVVTCGTDGEFRTWTRVWGEGEDEGGEEGERKGAKQGRGGVKGGGGRGRGGVQGSGQAKTARERMEEREAGIAPLTFCWRCRGVGSYASQPLLAASFSWEGSLLAVAALHRVTLWDPDRHALLAVLHCAPSLSPLQAGLPWHQPVTALAFLPHSPFLLAVSGALAPSGTYFTPPGSTAAPYAALSVWSLLSLSLAWCLHLRVLSLATHPSAPLFAVIVAAPTAGGGGGRGGDTGQGGGVEKDEEGGEGEEEEHGEEVGPKEGSVGRSGWARRSAGEGGAVKGAVLVFEGGESPVPIAAWEMADVTAATVAFLPPSSAPAGSSSSSSKEGTAQWSIVVVSGGREYAVLNGEESRPAPDAAGRDVELSNGAAAGMADGQALSAFESIYGAATTAAAVAAAAGGLSEKGRAAGEGRGQGEMEAVEGRPWGSLLSAPSHVLPSLSRLSNVAGMLQHCRAEHGGFDLKQLRAAQKWDEYQCIRAVNFIRTHVAAHRCIHCLQSFPSPPDLIQHMEALQHFLLPPLPLSTPPEPSAPAPWGDDAYLRSFLEGDPVLYSLDDDDEEGSSEGGAKGGSADAAGGGGAREASAVVDVTGLPLTAAAAGAAAAAAAAAEGGGVGSEEERSLAFQELLSLAQGEGAGGEQGEGEGAGAESSGSGGAGVQAARTGGVGGGVGSSGIPSGGTSGGSSVGKGKEKVGEVAGAGGEVEGWEGADGEDVAPSLEQYVTLANQVLLLRQQNAQLAHQLAATSAGRAPEGPFSATAGGAGTAAPRTPFSTPMVSPSPSTASLIATATAAAAIASAAAQASGASNTAEAATADGAAAGAGAGPAAPSAAAAAWQAQSMGAPRTPFSTPLVSPCPSYASLATAAAAAAAAAGVGESGVGSGMHEGSVKDMLLQVRHGEQQHKQGRPPIPVSPRPASTGALAAEKAVGVVAAKAGLAGGEGTAGLGLEGGGSGTGSPVVPRTPFSTPLASPSPSYALLPLDEAQRKLAAVAETVDGAMDGEAAAASPAAPAVAGAGGKGEGDGEEGQAARKRRQVTFGAVRERQVRVIDANYFSSYAGFGIHREMLSDKVRPAPLPVHTGSVVGGRLARTTAYQAALEENPSLIEGATVLDVGCGTGILSLFAARGGAARVVAVDGSREILTVAQQIARDNGYLADAESAPPAPSSTSASAPQRTPRPVVSFVCSKIEDLSPAPTGTTQAPAQAGASGEGAGGGGGGGEVALERGSVDVIVSEWMGYALLYESMLPSVLHARDTWLKPGGALLPDTASMGCIPLALFASCLRFICLLFRMLPLSHPIIPPASLPRHQHVAGFGEGATSVGFWRDVYGFSMASVAREIEDEAARTPLVQEVTPCISRPSPPSAVPPASSPLNLILSAHPLRFPPSTSPVLPALPWQHFDLCTVAVPDLDFTSEFCITPTLPTSSAAGPAPADSPAAATPASPASASPALCYGLALWFDTAFSARFCSAKPVLLSTSPFCTPTHWAQTLLTFREPIALAPAAQSTAAVLIGETPPLGTGAVGSEGRPAVEVRGRVSVVRASKHRSIDISVEVVAVGADGGKKAWPAQMFTI